MNSCRGASARHAEELPYLGQAPGHSPEARPGDDRVQTRRGYWGYFLTTAVTSDAPA
jgi:hypothetical protein